MSSTPGDNPIRQAADDALGRAPAAQTFARHVLSLDASEGVVVGVLGAWGSGKTSFVNLAREGFTQASIPVLDFNPWMFSGAQQLVESFFIEVSAQLKLRPGLEAVADDLSDYGEAFAGLGWLPVVGPWIERGRLATKTLGKLLSRRREGVSGRRAKVEQALKKLDRPILIVLDDIDRLSTPEIRDVFKLVRLTASFPSIIYVLAFDRARVEDALAEQNIPGRDYLEKILQIAVDLPAVPEDVLNRQVFAAIDGALDGIDNPGRFDEERWPDVYMEVIRPLIRNMRDVRRYAGAIRGTVEALGEQIALVDVLALEAIRVFLPDVFSKLSSSVEALTTTADLGYGGAAERQELKGAIEELIESAGHRGQVVRALIVRLFPAAQRHIENMNYGSDWKKTWLRERRIAHEYILRFYLERVVGEQLRAFTDAERAWGLMANRNEFEAYMRGLEPARLEDVVAALETYETEYQPDQVVTGSTVLLNLLPDMPDRPRGMFEYDTRLVVGRVVYRLVRSLGDPDVIEKATREILLEVSTLSSKFELVTDVGYREGAGHKLVSEAAAQQLEAEWRAEVRAASPDALARESDLLRVLLFAQGNLPDGEPQVDVPPETEVTHAVLRSAKTETRGQSMGSRAVRRSARLAWDALVKVYGDEATLRARIEQLKATKPGDDDGVLELADKYLDGWRPDDR